MASVLSSAAVCLVGAPTCSWVSHHYPNPVYPQGPEAWNAGNRASPREPRLIHECNLQRAAWSTQKAKRLTEPSVHMNQARPEYCRQQALTRLGGMQGQKRILFRFRTPSVSQERDMEGHEHALLYCWPFPGAMQSSGTEEPGSSLVTREVTLLYAGGSGNKHG